MHFVDTGNHYGNCRGNCFHLAFGNSNNNRMNGRTEVSRSGNNGKQYNTGSNSDIGEITHFSI